MTASKIFENYVEAIGGSKTLNGVKTIKTTVELTIPGKNIYVSLSADL
jgi:hypothetical protein